MDAEQRPGLLTEALHGGLIVSCQIPSAGPMDVPAFHAAVALSAQHGGAVGLRLGGGPNIAAAKAVTQVPIIGFRRRAVPGSQVAITPAFEDAREVREAGADIVALDATPRPRPGPDNFAQLARKIHEDLGALVLADVSTFDEGLAAEQQGADLVATTLSGYTSYTAHTLNGPDLDAVERLAGRLRCPVLAGGRIVTPQQARAALDAGAFAVVVGAAITSPGWLTSQFVSFLRAAR